MEVLIEVVVVEVIAAVPALVVVINVEVIVRKPCTKVCGLARDKLAAPSASDKMRYRVNARLDDLNQIASVGRMGSEQLGSPIIQNRPSKAILRSG